jgi:hypothetical protein
LKGPGPGVSLCAGMTLPNTHIELAQHIHIRDTWPFDALLDAVGVG